MFLVISKIHHKVYIIPLQWGEHLLANFETFKYTFVLKHTNFYIHSHIQTQHMCDVKLCMREYVCSLVFKFYFKHILNIFFLFLQMLLKSSRSI